MSLIATVPSPVLADSTLSGSVTYVHTDVQYDFAINGIPFQSAIDQNHPLLRKTAPYRKQSFDNSQEPGEQSLDFWWLKAQSTFHGGAGQNYIDTPVPQGQEIRPIRFNTSAGVNVWTQGQVSLLPTTSKAASIGAATGRLLSVTSAAGSNYLLYSDGANLWRVQETVSGGTPTYSSPTSVAWGGTGTIQSLATDGTNYYATDGTGIWKGDFTTPAVTATKIYALTAGTAVLSWVKQRLMLGYTTSTTSGVYELNSNAAVGSALPTAKYTHPNPGWLWTSFAEGPVAIYAAGYAGTQSTIYKFLLDSSGVTPTLTTAITTSTLPPGELVYGMYSYLGTTISLATSRGLRVAFFDTNSAGDFNYGPLSVSTSATTGSVTGQDRFLFYSYTDTSGVAGIARVDLSQQLNIRPFSYTPDQRFSWAPDLRATDNSETFVSGSTVVVDQIAGRVCFLVGGQGVFVQHPSKVTPSGSLTTSRIRYSTLDPKVVRYVRIRTEGSKGSVSVAVNDNTDSPGPINVTVSSQISNDSGDIPVYLPALTFVTATFVLTRDGSDLTAGGVLLGYQLKALPAQKRQRYIRVPLLCFDLESDSSGQESANPYGNAKQRLTALETLESAGDIVTFQMLSPFPDQEYSALCVIDDVQFEQASPQTERQGWGGIVTVTVRTVE